MKSEKGIALNEMDLKDYKVWVNPDSRCYCAREDLMHCGSTPLERCRPVTPQGFNSLESIVLGNEDQAS